MNNKSIEDLLNSNTDLDLSLLEQFSEYAPLSKDNEKSIIELGLKKLNKENKSMDSDVVIIEHSGRKFINFKRFSAVAASVLIILGVGFGLANVPDSNEKPLTGTSVSTKERETKEKIQTTSNDKDNDLNYRTVKDIQNQKLYCLSSSGECDSVHTGLSEINRIFNNDNGFVIFGTTETEELKYEVSKNFSEFYLHKDYMICSSGKIISVIQTNSNVFVIYYIDYEKSDNTLCRMEVDTSSDKRTVYECSLINNSNLGSWSDILEIFEINESDLLLVMSDRVILLDKNKLSSSSEEDFDIYKNTVYSTEKNIMLSFTDNSNRFNLIVSDNKKIQQITFRDFNRKKSSHVDTALKIEADKAVDFSSKIQNTDFDFIYRENDSVFGYNSTTKKAALIAESDLLSEGYSPGNISIDTNNNIYLAN